MHSSQTLKVLRERWKRGLLYAICNQLTPAIHVHTFFKQIVKNKCPWCPHVYKNMVKVPAWTPLCWNMLKCPQGFSSSGHVPSLQRVSVHWFPTSYSWCTCHLFFLTLTLKHPESSTGCAPRLVCGVSLPKSLFNTCPHWEITKR